MPLLQNIGTLATCEGGSDQADVGPIPDAALVWTEDRVEWVGREKDLPSRYRSEFAFDAGGRFVCPGLVDCHTHLAFGGWREDEFELRVRGVNYLDIARQGGGILRTVRDTRSASEEHLLDRVSGFATEMVGLGVTTIECKSGYGLTTDDELKLLRVYRLLAESAVARIVPTFLGAHVVPEEFRGRRDQYLRLICEEMIPRVVGEKLATFCDVFVEESAFTVNEARTILTRAGEFGLRAKLHADQLSDGGGAALAAEVRAVSADHLEQVSDDGILALRDGGVTAVALPFASLYVHAPPLNARRLIDAGVRVAVATDFNPGTAPSYHLPLAMSLACNLNRMTPREVLKGATYIAAQAIGRSEDIGSLTPGKLADFIVVNADSVNQWLYHMRPNAVTATFLGGRLVAGSLSEAM